MRSVPERQAAHMQPLVLGLRVGQVSLEGYVEGNVSEIDFLEPIAQGLSGHATCVEPSNQQRPWLSRYAVERNAMLFKHF
ncbi:hypothetical protein ABH944_004297 [Caballeronia udeis]